MEKVNVMPEANLLDSCRARKTAKEQVAKIELKIRQVENDVENYKIIQKHYSKILQPC